MKSNPRPLLTVSLLALSLGATACTVKDEDNKKPDSHDPDGGDTGGSTATGGKGGSGGTATGGKGGSGGTSPDGGPDGGVFTVSGKVAVGDQMFMDSDTADSSIDPTPNNDETTAQKVASPSFIGGYMGPLADATEDELDVYRVTLGAGDSATMFIGTKDDNTVPDFDLYLYDAANFDPNKPVDSSEGTDTPVEVVSAAKGGDYILLVNRPRPQDKPDTAGDAGRYTLAIGQAPSTNAVRSAAAHKLSQTYDFVPGEAIVKLKTGVSAVTKTWNNLHIRPASQGHNAIGHFRVALQNPTAIKGLLGANTVQAKWNRATTIAAIKRLQKDPTVLYAEPNYIRHVHAAAPNDPLYQYQWHYPQVNLLQAWDHTQGEGVIVAVLDTGVKLVHPDFKNSDSSSQLIAGYDMISETDIAADGDGRDANPDDPGDQELTNESSWHGTHVSGTIAAATNNGVGCAGVAPKAKIMPVRVLGVGGGTTDDIVQGILYASGLTNDAGVKPAKKADVINMSLGGRGLSRATADAIAQARAAGVIVVVSAGNDTADAGNYSPAGEDGVVTVSATNLSKTAAYYSNFGDVVEVAAPGGDESKDANSDGVPDGVLSLVYAKGGKALYSPYEGTSMSAPHVSGIVALMKSVYPDLTPDIFDSMLAATGSDAIVEDLGTKGRDTKYGYGLLNANQAVVAALAKAGTNTQTPVAQLSSTSLDFGAEETQLPLEIRNVGRGALTVTSATVPAPFAMTPKALGVNTVTIDRTGLADGVYTGKLSVVTNGGTVEASLRAIVGAAAVKGGDVGPVYVLVVDPQSNTALGQAVATATDGYAFEIPGLAQGDYILVGGTDIDDNSIVNDDGEAFGAFPVTSDPQILDPSASTDLTFPVRFQFNVTTAKTGPHAGGVKYRHR